MNRIFSIFLSILFLASSVPVHAEEGYNYYEPPKNLDVYLGGEDAFWLARNLKYGLRSWDDPIHLGQEPEEGSYSEGDYGDGFELIKDRTFVPIRLVAEHFGIGVKWEHETREVVLSGSGRAVRMQIGSKNYTINGEDRTMDVAPYISYSRTYVPMRFVAEALGIRVDYDHESRAALIGNFTDLDRSNEAYDYGIDPEAKEGQGTRISLPLVGGTVIIPYGMEDRYILKEEEEDGSFWLRVYSGEIVENPRLYNEALGIPETGWLMDLSRYGNIAYMDSRTSIIRGGPGYYLCATLGQDIMVNPDDREAVERFRKEQGDFFEILRSYRQD